MVLRILVLVCVIVTGASATSDSSRTIDIELNMTTSDVICYEFNHPTLSVEVNHALSELSRGTIFYCAYDPTAIKHAQPSTPFSTGIHRYILYMTVKTEPDQDLMRICCSLSNNGLVYFDDAMAISGMMPTDIPEIVSLDLIIRDDKGKLSFITNEKR